MFRNTERSPFLCKRLRPFHTKPRLERRCASTATAAILELVYRAAFCVSVQVFCGVFNKFLHIKTHVTCVICQYDAPRKFYNRLNAVLCNIFFDFMWNNSTAQRSKPSLRNIMATAQWWHRLINGIKIFLRMFLCYNSHWILLFI